MSAFDDERIGDAVYRIMYDTPAITSEIVYRIVITPVLVGLRDRRGVFTALLVLDVRTPSSYASGWTRARHCCRWRLLVTFPFCGTSCGAGGRPAVAQGRRHHHQRPSRRASTNILAVQSLGRRSDASAERFDRDSQELLRTSSDTGCVMAAMLSPNRRRAHSRCLFLLRRHLFVYAIGDEVIAGLPTTKGDFPVLLITYASIQLFFYAVELGALWINAYRGGPRSACTRVFFLMDLPAEKDGEGSATLPPIRQGIVERGEFEAWQRSRPRTPKQRRPVADLEAWDAETDRRIEGGS